ncbi:unnamed protein product [Merluccius merluccius]
MVSLRPATPVTQHNPGVPGPQGLDPAAQRVAPQVENSESIHRMFTWACPQSFVFKLWTQREVGGLHRPDALRVETTEPPDT